MTEGLVYGPSWWMRRTMRYNRRWLQIYKEAKEEQRMNHNPNNIMQYFTYDHLQDDDLQDDDLKAVSKIFCDAAKLADAALPAGPEKSVAMRKLLEAKDAAVRAALP